MDNSSGIHSNRSGFLFQELLKGEVPDSGKRKSFRKGDYVFEEGNSANGLYCILSGKVKISRLGESGKEQIVRLAGTRDVIGYRALLSSGRYRASAIALEETQVGFVSKTVFFDTITNKPEMALQMLKLLSQDLEQSESRMVDIATKSVRERVAEMLIVLKETYGFEPDGQTLAAHLSREDLAGMVGAAKEVVIRCLATFKEEEMIEARGRTMKLLNVKGLLRTAKLEG
ncbi:MAG: Crp/Fnr family transcriptional regulator [Bacteroidota bacterium]|nr:Crp/Fnr family transcriptional regulator [Bacteroidota bacterium]